MRVCVWEWERSREAEKERRSEREKKEEEEEEEEEEEGKEEGEEEDKEETRIERKKEGEQIKKEEFAECNREKFRRGLKIDANEVPGECERVSLREWEAWDAAGWQPPWLIIERPVPPIFIPSAGRTPHYGATESRPTHGPFLSQQPAL